ncbi:MAG TPA: sigma-70 family RNA polymerase sigma factor [Candidatus Angelobacter sp.]|jgi:RNA polymerase sigma factor (sigma-70 family)|nr:sigma-70 family RNA polymerase sigma factor [Candidatus Angelobacter sp.]
MGKILKKPILGAPPEIAADDEKLVQQCCTGDQGAWNELINRYKGLIYSVPVKYRFGPEDSADIFQSVCVELFTHLSKLRKIQSLRSWLVTVALHKCLHWQKQQRRQIEFEAMAQFAFEAASVAPDVLSEIRREQAVRDALERLSPRCAELIKMLFFEEPPLPYNEVARRLGLATGSIGFIRSRCLHHLQNILQEFDF